MEMPSHCTVSARQSRFDPLWLLLLTLGTLFVHGYHPWAEDGGLYVASIEYKLDPSLFPHETAFVTDHLPFSVFTSAMAALVRLSHASLAQVLFAAYLLSTALMLLAALCVARQLFVTRAAHWTAVGLLAAWWTLPIAGTSLLLMDPYLTARSLSTPLSLLAVAAALQPWRNTAATHRSCRFALAPPALACVGFLFAAAAFHLLMAVYALAFILALRFAAKRPSRWFAAIGLACLPLLGAGVQRFATPESSPVLAAVHTRYYWFLAQWQWFEWMGLVGPLAIFALLLRWKTAPMRSVGQTACRAAITSGLLTLALAVIFAQEGYRAHPLARAQPLRVFLLLYALMIPLLGGSLGEICQRLSLRVRRPLLRAGMRVAPALLIGLLAVTMFFVQHETYPASIHVEWPGRRNPNGWVQAFLWVHEHTREDALFALDARYINTSGEDAQTFRALAQRDALPDFAKDGGEAANIPRLAPAWWAAMRVTMNLSQLSDPERDARLHPLGVQWVVLHADATTVRPCPYRNAVVKVCRLP